MRPDRPLLGAVACLAAGVALILGYCQGATSLNAAFPFSASNLHIDITTNGPAVFGGIGLIALGLLLLAWAVLAAIVSQIARLFARDDQFESILDRDTESSFDDEPYSGSLGISESRHEG
ncbi:exported hypothetical protein [Candidatus Sulfotelmatomonas gaucii]|uniref:Uncharacterized protein n=1 Tax=Candidatus Sulfuritelmatomonas gaucii TaxID=2043161 RepID=A0A2N9L654_9BACT|nr:exported hypothetical protein [Candidatus Sulfotelmatomonas gaucii]